MGKTNKQVSCLFPPEKQPSGISCLNATLVNQNISQKVTICEVAGCAAANQIHSAVKQAVQRQAERERALIGGQLLNGLKCCYTSKPHIMGLDDKIL